MKTNTIVWMILVLLTVTGVIVSDAVHGPGAAGTILVAALGKTILVGWRFMELHTAHLLWKSAFLLLMAGLLGLFYGLA